MPLAIVCPGQGSQHAHMFDILFDNASAQPILEKISALSGLNLKNLESAAVSGELAQNRVAQILVVGHSLALSAALTQWPDRGLVIAGYSVGDVSAHAVAGALSVDDALRLADARGRAMDRAASGCGVPLGMTGIRGLSVSVIEQLATKSGVEVALVNGRDHVVLGGPNDRLTEVESSVAAAGAHFKRLGVTVASHTFYLKSATQEFESALQSVAWKRPSHRLLSPIDGAAVATRERAVASLSGQISSRLDWESTMQALSEYGVTATLELGAGRALSGMIDESAQDITARAVDDFKTVEGLQRWIGQQAG